MFRVLVLLVASSFLSHAQSGKFTWIRQVGGSGNQALAGLAVDSAGNIYAAGSTTSLDLPTTANAIQPRAAAAGLLRIDGAGPAWQNLYQSGLSNAGSVVIDPSHPQTVYATSATDLRKSTDGGATWSILSTQTFSAYNGLAVDPSNSNTLYAAAYNQGLLKSADGGATWTSISNGLATPSGAVASARGIWVDPNQPAVLLATVITNDWVLARSSDAGASWQVVTGPAALNVGTISFDPFTSSKVYAANGLGMAVSTDDGATWNVLAAGSPAQSAVILPDPRQPGVLYGGGSNTLWKSTDGGVTWTQKIQTPAQLLAADASTGLIYAAFGYHVVVTADGFDTVTPAGPPSILITAMAAAGGHLFVGTQGSTDLFVVKYDAAGNLVWSTYFGGTASDVASAVVVDGAGAVYVAGSTQSLDFPVTANAYAKSGGGFLFKLNPDGSLAWSTYFATPANALAVDAAGHAYLAGTSGGGTPTTPGSYQPKFNGTYCGIGCLISIPPTNGFLTEFDPTGGSLVFSTYLGTQEETAIAVGLLPDGSPVVAGQGTLYHLDPAGSSLLGTKPIGTVTALAPDGGGNLLAAGQTSSSLFPTTAGAFQTALYPQMSLPGSFGNYGSGDAFVMRLDPQLNILQSTLLGGEAPDMALGVAAGPGGTVLAAGSTYSQAFPTRGSIQSSFNITTGFLSQLSGDLSSLLFSTYAGDTRPFYVRSVAAAPDGGIVFGGTTGAPPYYVSGGIFGAVTANAVSPNAGAQAFVVRTDLVQAAGPRIDSVVNAASQIGVALSPGETIQVRGSGFGSDATLLLNGNALPLLAIAPTVLTTAVPSDFSAGTATVEVDSGGGRDVILAPGAAVSPGVFAGYIFNKDGTPNSPNNPSNEGDPITICATGVGGMTFNQGYAVTDSFVDVLIDGFEAPGIAAVLGPVAGLPGQVYQISVYVPRPRDYAAGNPNLQNFIMPPEVALVLHVAGVYSQAGLALFVAN